MGLLKILNSKEVPLPVDKRIFIGHGHSLQWMKLQQFLTDTLGLQCDEFEAIPPAGKTIVRRLQEMLDAACFAFLVFTAEEERADGSLHARDNVVHEAGLFQGRLGFERAIIVLEEECAEFSNVQGLVEIRFPRNNIGACFEEVRRVLLRERILDGVTQRGFAPDVYSSKPQAQGTETKYIDEIYWDVKEGRVVDGPFCPRCYDDKQKKVHLRETFVSGVADMRDVKYGGHMWICSVCHYHVDRNPRGGLTVGAAIQV